MTNTFDLPYLVDNGYGHGWATDYAKGCKLVRWKDDGDYSVLDANGDPLGWGETKEEALNHARSILTERRRIADGIPAKWAEREEWRKSHPLQQPPMK